MDAWIETETTADLCVAFDLDDGSSCDFGDYTDLILQGPQNSFGFRGPRERIGRILNKVSARYTDKYDYIGFMGDDHLPRTTHWDKELEKELDTLGTGVVWANDLLQGPNMPTMVLMDSRIIRTLGYMVPPTIEHLCADLVWKDLGEGMKRVRYREDVIVEHMHPANGKAEPDALYADVNSSAQATRDAEAYYAYRDEPPGTGNTSLAEDIQKLQVLL